MDAWLASREKEKGTGKFDKKERTLPGGMKATTYTRKHDDEEDSDDEVKSDAPKKKGRPKGKDKGPERVTKGAWKHKGARKVKEGDMEGSQDHDEAGEFGNEGGYVKNELHTMVRVARDLERHLRDNEDLPTWCIGKLSQAKGMVVSVMDYIMSEKERGIEAETGEEGITLERAVSKDQAIAARIARGVQKGEVKAKPGSASAEMAKMAPKELKKFAKTPTKGLPKHVEEESTDKEDQRAERAGKKVTKDIEHDDKKDRKEKKEEKVDETTVAGSVATATPSGKSNKGGMQFGKGVYESFNNSIEQMITESITVQENVEECGMEGGQPSITIQADGEEAAKLMMLLKLAGLDGQSLEENKPDWPTNTEKSDNAFQYSGGLNGPKSTGQTTTVGGGIPNYQARRQVSMEESVELERTLFKTWQKYKG